MFLFWKFTVLIIIDYNGIAKSEPVNLLQNAYFTKKKGILSK